MKRESFERFIKKLPPNDYVVRVKYKYTNSKAYTYENVLYLGKTGRRRWLTDWYNDKDYASVEGYISISAVGNFMPCKGE